MPKFFIILAFAFLWAKTYSQNQEIDSLRKLLNANMRDTSKLSILKKLVDASPDGEWEKYNLQMKSLAEKCLQEKIVNEKTKRNYLEHLSYALHNQGVFFVNELNDFDGLKSYEKSAKISKELGNKEALIDTELEIAKLHTRQGNTAKAISLLYRCLKNYEEINNYEGIGDVYTYLSSIYGSQIKLDKAMLYIDKAYENFKKADYKPGIYKALYRKAFLFSRMEQADKALEYFDKSTAELDSIQREEQAVSISNNLAVVFTLQKKYDKAILQYKKSLELAFKKNQKPLIRETYVRLSDVYYKVEDFTNFIITGEKALYYTLESKDVVGTCRISERLSEVYGNQGNYKKAFNMYKLYTVSQDSIDNKETRKNMLEQQLKYDYEKKETAEKTLNERKIVDLKSLAEIENSKKNSWIILLVSFSILSFFIIIFLFKYYQQKNEIITQKVNLFKQKLLLAQMNPHFIFNSINSIQNYVLNKKENEAYNYLAKFSKLIRMVLNNSRENTLSLHYELEALNLYIELEQLRFDNSFEYHLNIADEIDLYDFEIPTMFMQPYVENAIWHGLMNLKNEKKGILKIDISIDSNLLKVVIEDNGVGRVRSNEFKNEDIHQPIAMKLTEERLEMINKMENTENVKVIVSDLHDEEQNACGTRVELFLPLMN